MIKLIEMAEDEIRHMADGDFDNACGRTDSNPKELAVRIGAMTGVLPEYLRRYFPEAAKGTHFDGAELLIEEVPVETECDSCGNHYEPTATNGYACPTCGGKSGHIIHGRECELSYIAW